MPWQQYQPTKPAGTDPGPNVMEDVRQNFFAVLVMLIEFGAAPGWDGEAQDSDGTPSSDLTKPDQWVFSWGVYRIKLSMTYSANGDVTTITGRYSENSGSSYALMATTDAPNAKRTLTYDASGEISSIAWS